MRLADAVSSPSILCSLLSPLQTLMCPFCPLLPRQIPFAFALMPYSSSNPYKSLTDKLAFTPQLCIPALPYPSFAPSSVSCSFGPASILHPPLYLALIPLLPQIPMQDSCPHPLIQIRILGWCPIHLTPAALTPRTGATPSFSSPRAPRPSPRPGRTLRVRSCPRSSGPWSVGEMGKRASESGPHL